MPRHRAYVPHGVIPAVLLPFHDDLSIDERASAAHLRDVAATDGHLGAHHQCAFDRGRFLHVRRAAPRARDRAGRDRRQAAAGAWHLGGRQPRSRAHRQDGGARAAPRRCWCFRRRRSRWGRTPQMALAHFKRIADACDLPLIAFQYPLATGQGYPKDTLLRLCDEVPTHPRHQGLVDNVPQHEWHVRTLQALPRPVNVLTTHCAWLMSSLVLGCNGLLSGSGSVIADLQARLFRAVQGNDLAEAKRLNDRIDPMARVFYADPAVDMHNRMKEALVLLGKLPRAVVRPPLVKIGRAEIERIRQALVEAGLLGKDAARDAA